MKPTHPRPRKANGCGPAGECIIWPVRYITTIAGVDIYADQDTKSNGQLMLVWGDPAEDELSKPTWTFSSVDPADPFEDWYSPPAPCARSSELHEFLITYHQLVS